MKNGFVGVWILLLAAAIGLAFVAFGVGFYLSSGGFNIPVDQPEQIEDQVEGDSAVEDEIVGEVNPEDLVPQVESQSGFLDIVWFAEPREVVPLQIFTDSLASALSSEATGDIAAFALGTIASGEYKDMELTVQLITYGGFGTYYRAIYTLLPTQEGEKPVIIDTYGDTSSDFFSGWRDYESTLVWLTEAIGYASQDDLVRYQTLVSQVIFDTEAVISEFEYDEIINDASGHTYRLEGISHLMHYPEDQTTRPYSAVSSVGGENLYAFGEEFPLAAIDGLFFMIDEGNRMVVYDVYIPFWDYADEFQNELTIVGDTTITGTYAKSESGGCGWRTITNVVPEDEIGPLSWLGYAEGTYEEIYEPENYPMEYYLDDYNTWLNWHEGQTFEDFVALHPILYYQDNLGRWIKLVNVEVLPQAECGKPVIYLYPEEPTQIDVQLELEGGFSYTEPAYGNGWSVMAYPDGSLVNLEDGVEYPYLFWEGKGGLYQAPEQYWVVAREDVERFLVKTLGKIGLNRQEIADFMEFWYPRMQAAPYYKIGFHMTDVMNALAPMTLSEQPDALLRILIDYSELQEPIEAHPPIITGFDRTGFTVVEWGGVIQ